MRRMASGGGLSPGLPARHAAGVSGSPRVGVRYFGGVFRCFATTTSGAVKKILRGHQREETSRFIAFRSHWRFQSEFCTPAGATRRAAWKAKAATSGATTGCRCQQVRDLEELNAYLEAAANRTSSASGAVAARRSATAMLSERAICCRWPARVRSGGDQLSHCEWSGLCAGADQLLLGAVAGGHAGASARSRRLCRALARRQVRGAA